MRRTPRQSAEQATLVAEAYSRAGEHVLAAQTHERAAICWSLVAELSLSLADLARAERHARTSVEHMAAAVLAVPSTEVPS